MRKITCTAVAVLLLLTAVYAQESDPPQGSIYEKPYIAGIGGRAVVGGYVDIEYISDEDGSTFDQHRLIPFIYSKIDERIFFSTEIEFEHGGNPDKDGEIKLEYGALDVVFSEKFTMRAGLLLAPLGRFNIYHDSPLNDLTDRPLVARQIIPTTLSESGVGFHGRFYAGEQAMFSYEVYLVNGFNESLLAISDDSSSYSVRIRKGRGSAKADNNRDKALSGRLLWSPRLGLELAGSIHVGKYDDADNRNLTISALDFKWQRGRYELLAEVARANIEIPGSAGSDGERNQSGYYVQANYHLFQGMVPQWRFSTFTAVARYGFLDYDTEVEGDGQERLTFGINFRPTEETVMKLDYRYDWEIARGISERGRSSRTFLLSMASYF